MLLISSSKDVEDIYVRLINCRFPLFRSSASSSSQYLIFRCLRYKFLKHWAEVWLKGQQFIYTHIWARNTLHYEDPCMMFSVAIYINFQGADLPTKLLLIFNRDLIYLLWIAGRKFEWRASNLYMYASAKILCMMKFRCIIFCFFIYINFQKHDVTTKLLLLLEGLIW